MQGSIQCLFSLSPNGVRYIIIINIICYCWTTDVTWSFLIPQNTEWIWFQTQFHRPWMPKTCSCSPTAQVLVSAWTVSTLVCPKLIWVGQSVFYLLPQRAHLVQVSFAFKTDYVALLGRYHIIESTVCLHFTGLSFLPLLSLPDHPGSSTSLWGALQQFLAPTCTPNAWFSCFLFPWRWRRLSNIVKRKMETP